jgi:hypothetical protein
MTRTLATRIENLERNAQKSRPKYRPVEVWVHRPAVNGNPERWESLDGRESYTPEEFERARADPSRLQKITPEG